MADSERISLLFQQYLRRTCTKAELLELKLYIDDAGAEERLGDVLHLLWNNAGREHVPYPVDWEKMYAGIVNASAAEPVLHRISFFKTALFRYAAAFIIMFGFGTVTYFRTTQEKNNHMPADAGRQTQMDIPPGGERAVLTLDDGTRILLDSAANGNLANQGKAQIVKLINGQITYNIKESGQGEVMMNTMSTPKGGQYRLILPDGTKVWLNAASSITYPAVFAGTQRNVKVNGEAYFEVAKNNKMPFIVNVDERSAIQVLGTSFNINSYTDEEVIRTTLIEGSVRVSKTGATTIPAVILKPGQQATIDIEAPSGLRSKDPARISVVNSPDIEKALAWKNGWFNFNGLDLKAVMRQLERWYDIEVQYQGSVDNGILRGQIYRSVNLSDVLDILQKVGEVRFRLEGKTLIVTDHYPNKKPTT